MIAEKNPGEVASTSSREMVLTQWGDYIPKETAQWRYGFYWNASDSDLMIELRCFKLRVKDWQGGLGKAGHFREIVGILWGKHNDRKRFIFNPWSDKMLEEALAHKYLSIAGAASSGKSLFFAIYAIVNWLCDPVNTTILITSTSLKESRGRIWADIEEWWNAAQHVCGDSLPGKLVSSLGLIHLLDPSGEMDPSKRSGIHLIAGEKKKEKETIGKMIGYKNKRFLFIGDEMPELSAALIEAATGNLDSAEKEWFQFVGIGNPNSIYDPHGVFSKPKDGWKSVTPAVFEWETDLGYCVRFDAYQSPNILAGKVLYPWLPTLAKVEEKKAELGEDSLAFWRMWRGFWCPTGGTESVVAEADIIGFDCDQKVTHWKIGAPATLVAFLDPAFTNGGDRSVVYFAKYGINAETDKWTLEYVDYVVLKENIMEKGKATNFQIAEAFKQECEKRGVTPDRAAVDDTGAAAFGDIVHTIWSRLVTRINFGGAATEMPVSAHNKTRACDKYKNRVTEIWCSVREFMRSGQIRGIGPDFGIELTSRRMVHKKSGAALKEQVEPKEKMRNRMGKSPDIADAGLGLLDFCRSKFHFRAAARSDTKGTTKKTWGKFMKKNDFFGKHSPVLDRS